MGRGATTGGAQSHHQLRVQLGNVGRRRIAGDQDGWLAQSRPDLAFLAAKDADDSVAHIAQVRRPLAEQIIIQVLQRPGRLINRVLHRSLDVAPVVLDASLDPVQQRRVIEKLAMNLEDASVLGAHAGGDLELLGCQIGLGFGCRLQEALPLGVCVVHPPSFDHCPAPVSDRRSHSNPLGGSQPAHNAAWLCLGGRNGGRGRDGE